MTASLNRLQHSRGAAALCFDMHILRQPLAVVQGSSKAFSTGTVIRVTAVSSDYATVLGTFQCWTVPGLQEAHPLSWCCCVQLKQWPAEGLPGLAGSVSLLREQGQNICRTGAAWSADPNLIVAGNAELTTCIPNTRNQHGSSCNVRTAAAVLTTAPAVRSLQQLTCR